jgi:N-methylhydantoinase A
MAIGPVIAEYPRATNEPNDRAYVIGVDVGGTFTDVFVLDERSGQVMTGKVSSTRGDQSKGFVEGIGQPCRDFR